MRIVTRAAAFPIMALITGCASLPLPCMPPSRIMTSAEMILGRNIGDRPGVGEVEFADFVTREIAPRFPDGLTVIDAHGQWRDNVAHRNVRERTKVVLLTFVDDPRKRADLVAVAESYKRRFSQRSVLTQVRDVCVSF